MKKILYLSANGYIGGAERFILNICKLHIVKKEYQPCILFFNNGEAVREAEFSGIPHFILKNKFKLTSPHKLLRAILEIRTFTKQMNPDWVHTTMPYTQIVYGLASFGLRAKIAWFQHGPVGGKLDKIASLFQSHLLLFNSQFLKKAHFASVLMIRSKNIEIIKLGVECAATKREIFLKNEINLGASGRICSWKGFHLIIDSLQMFKQKHPQIPFKFYLAGSAKSEKDIEYEISLKNKIIHHDLSNEIKIIGHVGNIAQFYQSLDVFIHASTIPEPFGLVVAEAMGQGCFVIGSNQGGVTDLIQNEVTGLSFASTDDEAAHQLYSILENLIIDFERSQFSEYKRMQDSGYQLIRNQYSLISMLNEIEKLYDDFK